MVIEVHFLGRVELYVVGLDEHFVTDLNLLKNTGRQPLLSFLKYHP